jgi:hypothetical protein
MGEQIFNRIKKMLGVLLVVFFVASLTVASVSAATGSGCSKGKISGLNVEKKEHLQ